MATAKRGGAGTRGRARLKKYLLGVALLVSGLLPAVAQAHVLPVSVALKEARYRARLAAGRVQGAYNYGAYGCRRFGDHYAYCSAYISIRLPSGVAGRCSVRVKVWLHPTRNVAYSKLVSGVHCVAFP
jgi:hypothetical protein